MVSGKGNPDRYKKYKARYYYEFRDALILRDLLVEFVASFFLMVVQSTCVQWWGNRLKVRDLEQTLICMAFVVVGNIASFSGVAEVIMNPAVTLGLMLKLKMTISRGLVYMGVQICGCLAGSSLAYAIYPETERNTLAMTLVHPDVQLWAAVLWEVWCASLLGVVANANMDFKRHYKYYFGEGTLFFLVYAAPAGVAIPTGAALNPARALAPTIIMGNWLHHWIYWVGPPVGFALGTFVYTVLLDLPDKHKVERERELDRVERDERCQQLVQSVLQEMTEKHHSIYTEDMEKLVNELVKH